MTNTNAQATLYRTETKGRGLTCEGIPVTFDRAVWFVESRDFTPPTQRTTQAEREAFDQSEFDTFRWFLEKATGWSLDRIEVSTDDEPPSRLADHANVVGMMGPLNVPIFNADRIIEGSKDPCDIFVVRGILLRYGDGATTRAKRRALSC